MRVFVTDDMTEVEKKCAFSITVFDLNYLSNMKEEYVYRPASTGGFTVYRSLCE